MTSVDRRDVWSRYWATGVPHSCGGSYDDRYGGHIAAFWHEAFDALMPGAQVLDIATGNAALPRLLLDRRTETSITCDAVDLARIAPPWLSRLGSGQRARLRLHSEVLAESLPFADQQFALVVSQFGIEYADVGRAVPELLRVLAPNGRVRVLVHHAESRPVRLAGEEIDHIDWMLAPGGFLDLASAMIEPMSRAATAEGRASLAVDEAANAIRGRFNAIQGAIAERIERSPCPDVLHEMRDAVAQVLAMAVKLGARHAAQTLSDLRDKLADARLRLDELRRHALDNPSVQAFVQRLESGGLTVSHEPLSDAGHLLGWALRGQRPT